jgi:hypothetical protein
LRILQKDEEFETLSRKNKLPVGFPKIGVLGALRRSWLVLAFSAGLGVLGALISFSNLTLTAAI